MSDSRPVSPPSRWTRRRIIGLAVLLLVVAGIAWLALRPAAKPGGGGPGGRSGGGRPNMAAAMANLAVPVRVASAVTQDIDIFLKSLGTVTAYNTVTVRSRVS
ncbi:MdtA/MuxA family multidrug efflux RND transporter periplasmic adaptor subunit, partial [Pseudomonas aeruginosa]